MTLNNLLEKIPTLLKPFLPQLQRTFAKSLADTSSELLRSRAAKALGTLITMTPRIDPLIAGMTLHETQLCGAFTDVPRELVTGSKTTDPGVKNAMLKALYEVVSKAGAKMSETSRNAVLGVIDNDIEEKDGDSQISSTLAVTQLTVLRCHGNHACATLRCSHQESACYQRGCVDQVSFNPAALRLRMCRLS